MPTKITFNGTEYASPDEMPPEVRAEYEHAIDLVGKQKMGGPGNPRISVKISTNMKLLHNGKLYTSTDDMPPEVRAKFDQAMEQMDKNHDGVPDFLEGNATRANQSAPASNMQTTFGPTAPLISISPKTSAIAPDRTSKSLLTIAGIIIVILLLALVGLLVYIYYGSKLGFA